MSEQAPPHDTEVLSRTSDGQHWNRARIRTVGGWVYLDKALNYSIDPVGERRYNSASVTGTFVPDPALFPPEHPCAPDELRLAAGWELAVAHINGFRDAAAITARGVLCPDGYKAVPGAPGKPRLRDGMWAWWVRPVGGEK